MKKSEKSANEIEMKFKNIATLADRETSNRDTSNRETSNRDTSSRDATKRQQENEVVISNLHTTVDPKADVVELFKYGLGIFNITPLKVNRTHRRDRNPLIIVSLSSLDEKIRVLRRKRQLRGNSNYYNVYIRAGRPYAERLAQQNMHAILNELPNGRCYTVNNNGRVTRREYENSQNIYPSYANVVSGNNNNRSQNYHNNNFRTMNEDNYQAHQNNRQIFQTEEQQPYICNQNQVNNHNVNTNGQQRR